MNKLLRVNDRTFLTLSYLSVILFSVFPIFFSLPFRIHIDLPFEGAYRLYLGQAPYVDFGMPFGYGFFIVPTLFFHLFGPSFSTLLLGQAFLNIVSGITLISVLGSLKTPRPVLFLSVFIYCLSYIFIYFWPWHNHSAFTYGLIALSLILKYNESASLQKRIFIMSCAGLFSFISFFTKQDYGGLNFLFCLIILIYLSFLNKNFRALSTFILAYLGTAMICILPWINHGFGYWFNHGQPPHTSRLAMVDFLNEIFMSSVWEKFYFLAFAIILLIYVSDLKSFLADSTKVFTFLICTGMIVQALLTKVTSRHTSDTTTYYHAFAVAFILPFFYEKMQLHKTIHIALISFFTFLWWSPMYWKYASRIFPMGESKIPRKEDVIKVQKGWEVPTFKTLKKVKLPLETIQGMQRLKTMPQFQPEAKVLNMTELTSLPVELNYTPLTGLPLWYDLGVCMFPKQVKEVCEKIKKKEYDVVMFEEVPILDNYFPEEIRETLQKEYKRTDTFMAPRQEESAFIEVYIRP